MNIEDLILEIRKLYFEYKNPRNDGWVQKDYKDRLVAIKKLLESLELEES